MMNFIFYETKFSRNISIFIMWYFSTIDPDKIVEKVGMNFFIIFFFT